MSIENALFARPRTLIVAGDFNDRCTDWESNHVSSELGNNLLNLSNALNLTQFVHSLTRIVPGSESIFGSRLL